MQVPYESVKLLHRVLGLRTGSITIRKEGGLVLAVEVNGRVLDPSEYTPQGDVPRGTISTKRAKAVDRI